MSAVTQSDESTDLRAQPRAYNPALPGVNETMIMTISMYEASIPTFVHSLRSLRAILQKALAHAEAKKFDPTVLASARLFPDMLPLTRQVQIAADAAKGCAARLAGVEAPKFEDNETTLPQLIARVDKTLDYLQGFKAEQIDGSEERSVSIKLPKQTLTFPGLAYLRHWAIPNFYFHVTTTYALLRHNGVEIGKPDYIGDVPH
jgi:uncharacterized protein